MKHDSNPLSLTSRRFKMRLEFDGAGFCGWQLQDSKVEGEGAHLESVQGVVERSLNTFLRKKSSERIAVQGCGRTDAGVHAREYYCHFDLMESDSPVTIEQIEKMRHALNCIFPAGVVATHLESCALTFHALKNVEKKIYEYRVLFRRAKPTIDLDYCWWIPRNYSSEYLDLESFQKCLKSLEGTHDFAAFMAAHSDIKTTVRTLFSCSSKTQAFGQDISAGTQLKIQFCGDGFLKHQVRNMVGSLMDVAQRIMSADKFRELIGAAGVPSQVTRTDAGYCAPPHGLFLTRVFYQNGEQGCET